MQIPPLAKITKYGMYQVFASPIKIMSNAPIRAMPQPIIKVGFKPNFEKIKAALK